MINCIVSLSDKSDYGEECMNIIAHSYIWLQIQCGQLFAVDILTCCGCNGILVKYHALLKSDKQMETLEIDHSDIKSSEVIFSQAMQDLSLNVTVKGPGLGCMQFFSMQNSYIVS